MAAKGSHRFQQVHFIGTYANDFIAAYVDDCINRYGNYFMSTNSDDCIATYVDDYFDSYG